MTKHIIISLLIIAGLSVIGNFAFSDKKAETVGNFYATSTPIISTTTATQATSTPIINQITNHMVTIETNYGKIVFETYDKESPNTAENFVGLANKGFYDGVIFHRVIKGFMIQGGDPTGTGMGGPGYQFADEIDPNSALYKTGYKKGIVAMANAGPNTNGSQFFIMTQDYPLPPSYTIFGRVISGQDIVDKIANVATNQNDKPLTAVTMIKVTVK
jgi:cyclophilin family peptidyl-prolyl cis-trans isomerase